MSSMQMSTEDKIRHYQRSIDRSLTDHTRLLHCIKALAKLPVSVQLLTITGVGRTVNALRKIDNGVGDAAKHLVGKWKEMVSNTPTSPETDDHGQEEQEHHEYDSNYCEQEYESQPEDTAKRKSFSNGIDESEDLEAAIANLQRSNSPTMVIDVDTRQEDSSNDENDDEPEEEEDEEESKSKSSNHSSKNSSSSSKKDSTSKSSSRDKHSSSKDKHSKDGKSSRDKDSSEHKKKEKSKSSSRDKEKKTSESQKRKVESSSSEGESKKKRRKSIYDEESDEEIEQNNFVIENDDNNKRDSSSEDEQSETESQSRDKESSRKSDKHKSKDKHHSSSSHSSKTKNHESSDKSKKESKHSSSKSEDRKKEEKRKSDKDKESSKSKSSSSSKESKSKESSSKSRKEEKEKKDSKDDKGKSKEKKEHKEHKDQKVKKEKKKMKTDTEEEGGIDGNSGTSFADALGMCMMPPPSKKKKENTSFSSKSSTSKMDEPTPSHSKYTPTTPTKAKTESKYMPASPESPESLPLLSPNIKLEPLSRINEEVDLAATLPEPSLNYKPLPQQNSAQRKLDEDEMLSKVIHAKNQRTKVFSGNKSGWTSVPTLYEMCIRVLIENIDALEYTGGVPYYIIKPVLERATPDQLFILEHHNPYLMEDSDHLWQFHCNKDFRTKHREEMESWREMYMRCLDEREAKLKALTANIKQSIDKSLPVRQTKLAYVDHVVKPPRNVLRQQAKYGTAHVATKASDLKKKLITGTMIPSTSSSSNSGNYNSGAGSSSQERISVPPPPIARSRTSTSSTFKKAKAPLMAKALQAIKGRYKR